MGLLSAVTFGQVDAELLQESKEHKKKHKKVADQITPVNICTRFCMLGTGSYGR
jgi:hypothetical protein